MNIGPGSVVMAGCVVNADAHLGAQVIVNTGATVDHDCRIEDNVHIAPGCHLCGNVVVGQDSLLGAGATVTPGVRIGRHVIVGAGSTVIRDIADETTVSGTPADHGLNMGRRRKTPDPLLRLALEGGAPVRNNRSPLGRISPPTRSRR